MSRFVYNMNATQVVAFAMGRLDAYTISQIEETFGEFYFSQIFEEGAMVAIVEKQVNGRAFSNPAELVRALGQHHKRSSLPLAQMPLFDFFMQSIIDIVNERTPGPVSTKIAA